MTTVMIVDDEKPARELLKMAINWKSLDLQIICEAANGAQALAFYKQNPVDLIFTDIQMPVMDGLEFIKEVKTINPNQKIIILSCHESFQYVKRAIHLGVVDYLVKDMLNEEVLFNLLKRMSIPSASISVEPLSVPIINDIPSLPSKFEDFTTLLTHNFEFFACSVRLEDYYGTSEELSMLCDSIEAAFSENIKIIATAHDENTLTIIPFLLINNSKLTTYNHRFNCIQTIQHTLKKITNCELSTGVSYSYHEEKKYQTSIDESIQALEHRVFHGRGKTLYYDISQSRHQKIQISFINKAFKKIRTALENNEIDVIKKELQLLYHAEYDGYIYYNYLNYLNFTLLNIFTDICNSNYLSYADVFDKTNIPLDEINSLEDNSIMEKWAFDKANRIVCLKDSNTKNKYSPRICKIRKYIRDHIVDDISLDTVADAFSLHKGYLAKIFKQETGSSVNDYIHFLRIEKAKELLLQSDIRISEIASAVGFNSTQSFYSVFKQYTKISPGEYRKQ